MSNTPEVKLTLQPRDHHALVALLKFQSGLISGEEFKTVLCTLDWPATSGNNPESLGSAVARYIAPKLV